MKKIFLFALLIAFSCIRSLAHDFTIGGIYYNIIDKAKRTIEVSHRGSSSDSFNNEYYGSVKIPSSVKYKGTTYSVTSIDWSTFEGCTNLKSIVIPNSITNIGVGAFKGCANLTSIVIPNSVTWIRENTFKDCTKLKSIIIPNSVTEIGDYSFNGCTSLTSITIPNSVTDIGSEAFENTGWYYNQPDGILYLDNCCLGYKGETPTGELFIKEGSRLIGNGAFFECTGLTSIVIPNSVTCIGFSAFNGTNLKSITIPNSVTKINCGAFAYCTSLTKVNYNAENCLPISSPYICVFEGCTNLRTINFGDNVKTIPNWMFNSSGLKTIIIPYSVTEIGYNSFTNCENLESVTITNPETKYSEDSFDNHTKIIRLEQ